MIHREVKVNSFGILGIGNIGSAIARALLNKSRVKPEELYLCDNRDENIASLKRDYPAVKNVKISELTNLDCLLIAVKPQDFSTAAKLMSGLNKNCLVISLMAGHNLQKIEQETACPKVIRCMSNLPALCSMGMNVYCASKAVTDSDLKAAHELISSFGLAIKVEEEDLINSATAVSGSGPAYVFYLINALAKAAKAKGFNEGQALDLAVQTFHGAIHYFLTAECGMDELISRVATKGGTTEAALKTFESAKLEDIIAQGVTAAYKRSQEMEQGK